MTFLMTFLLDFTGYMLLKRKENCKNVRPLPKRIGKMGRFNRRQHVSSDIAFQKARLSRSWMVLNLHSANILGDWPAVCPTKGLSGKLGPRSKHP